jgi:hypothetical protein
MKKVIFLVVTLTIVGGYLQLTASEELKVIALALAILFVIALALTLFVFGWLAIEKVKMRRAERIERERDAHVKIVTAGNQVFIRDTDKQAYWRAAHLDPRFYANGQYSEPNPVEVEAWRAFNSPKVITQQAGAMIPATTQIDLLAALDPVQRCLIVGASDSGKTTLLQWLVSRRLNTSRVIVIDPHAYPQKWPNGAHVTGTGRNYLEIDRALTALVQLMTKRYDEIGRGLVAEMAHSRITILIDEWRAITGNLGASASDAIKALLTESRKAAFSVFVASHSDRAKPLGLMGEYDLKDGFCVVRLSVVDGQRTATIDTGNGPTPAVLPGSFAGQQAQVIEGRQWHVVGDDINLEPEPDDTEATILKLHQAGASVSAIARQVFGQKGGYQNQQVKAVLAKFAGV